jgi:peptidoglycan/LPS O-acetylase OafA/YrhL
VTSPPPDRTFRPDLEGLRAVAVGLVLLYHARVPGFRGGYVGVDVFFVLSGFLITGLLVRELQSTGRVSLAAFYARRARRLLPAAALVLVVTAILSALILPPLRMPDVAADIAWSAAYASNIRFALQATDYLAAGLAPSPVLHYWSLGVEEQFYLFWPLLVIIAAGAAFAARDHRRGLRRVAWALAIVFVTSLVLAVWLTGVQQPWAFFSLPTRAWELALGGLLAMPFATTVVGPALRPVVGWLGLALVIASGFVIDDTTPFPGTAALLPTLGCALVILGGLHPPSAREGARNAALVGPGALLSLPPVRYIGRISYSLYLWHWPVLVLPAVAFGHLPGPVRVGLAGVAVGLAAISQRFVEEPIRHGRFVGLHPPRVLAAAGALTLAVVVSATWLGSRSVAALQPAGPAVGGDIGDVILPAESARPSGGAGLPPLAAAPVPADLVPSITNARDDIPSIYDDGCHAPPAAAGVADGCVFGDANGTRTIVLFGDSHAAQWFPALERLANERHWRLVVQTKSACASADVPVWSEIFNRPYAECTAWRQAVFDLIASLDPAIVVLSNDRHYNLTIDGRMASSTDHEDVWSAGLDASIERLAGLGSEVVVIGDTVRQSIDPPVCLSEHLADASVCSTPYARAVATERLAQERGVTEGRGAAFVDPTSWMCYTDPCPSVMGRLLIYRDSHHLSATYARALANRLADVLPAIP